jgi:hypothetical protein
MKYFKYRDINGMPNKVRKFISRACLYADDARGKVYVPDEVFYGISRILKDYHWEKKTGCKFVLKVANEIGPQHFIGQSAEEVRRRVREKLPAGFYVITRSFNDPPPVGTVNVGNMAVDEYSEPHIIYIGMRSEALDRGLQELESHIDGVARVSRYEDIPSQYLR